MFYTETAEGGINYVYLGNRLIAKDGVIPENGNKQHYLPFGASVEGEINDVGYTGHKFDKDIGLSYMQARYYDPVLGRFMSPDPVGSADQFNLFAYVGNDPISNIDPSGMIKISLRLDALVVVVAGGVSESSNSPAQTGLKSTATVDASVSAGVGYAKEIIAEDGSINGISNGNSGSASADVGKLGLNAGASIGVNFTGTASTDVVNKADEALNKAQGAMDTAAAKTTAGMSQACQSLGGGSC